MPIRVEGNCPSCGEALLGLIENKLSCMAPGCLNKDAAHRVLIEPQKTDHLVSLLINGYSIKHPINERLDNELMHCGLAEHVAEFGQDWLTTPDLARRLQPGVIYRMWDDSRTTPDTPNGPAEYDYWVEWPTDDDGRPISFEQEQADGQVTR